MGLRLYNTLTRRKDDFVPIDPDNVRMYVCGPTVYDFAHIGNARPLIVFDVLFRLLRHLYGPDHVTYVRNITDVDDKINARAAEEFPDLPLNEAIREVTTRTERQFHADVDALGCLRPTVEPRATEFISRPDLPEDMIRLIAKLIESGHAYTAEGHVLFDVKSWRAADGSLEYGKLSNRTLDDMIAGARVEVAPYKKDPMDFVLWKPSKPGEPAWPSPWGAGRPGWHIECSAMAGALLGPTFDIHGGGIDLVFPHHENEIAQSRCAHDTPVMANYWLHNGFLQVEGEKMAKSAGNFATIRDVLDTPRLSTPNPTAEDTLANWKHNGQRARLAMLSTHYRSPIDWTDRKNVEATTKLAGWRRAVRGFYRQEPVPVPTEIVDALSDDLNTHVAISEIDRLANAATSSNGNSAEATQALAAALQLLGFEDSLEGMAGGESPNETMNKVLEEMVNARLESRAAARKAKDFVKADSIRDELDAMGIQLEDSKDPETGELVTSWEVKR